MTPLEIAITQIGKEEIPRGSNWGPHVEQYLGSVGIKFAASWCMAFVYWCFAQSKESGFLIKTAGVLDQWNRIDKKYRVSTPGPGDIFIMDFGKGIGHTGIVKSIEGLRMHTIEGNTNDTGSREGYAVCEKNRPVSSAIGFIRIPLK